MLRAFADGLLSVVLAPSCSACATPLEQPTRGPVCSDCWVRVVRFTPPLCLRCGDPIPSWRAISVGASTCPRCRRFASSISRSGAIGPYEGSLRSIIHAVKYEGRRSLAGPLGTLLRQHCADIFAGADLLVPVPLHWRRQRSRGFNQAEEMARGTSLRVVLALKRVRPTPSQTDLPAAQRHANVRDAFRLRRRTGVRGLCVVLIDDVCTTGATLEACARILREAGAADVRAVTAARVASQPRE